MEHPLRLPLRYCYPGRHVDLSPGSPGVAKTVLGHRPVLGHGPVLSVAFAERANGGRAKWGLDAEDGFVCRNANTLQA